MRTTRRAFAVATAAVVAAVVNTAFAQPHQWEPAPTKTDLMVVGAHGDDESIFFGGVIPYYVGVQHKSAAQVVLTWDPVRIPEIQEAAWISGLRNLPVQGLFKDYMVQSANSAYKLNANWDVWLDGHLDGDPSQYAAGRLVAATYMAEQIRIYHPDVVVAHDFGGEYGHSNHMGAAWAVADAFAMAADPNVDLSGLGPWQAQKLYMHLYNGTSSQPMVSVLQEDWSLSYSELGGLTPLQVSDAALDAYVSRGGASTLLSYYEGRRYSDQWGLYASMVGPDTAGADGIARGGMFEHVAGQIIIPEPPRPGDFNGDDNVDQADYTVWADAYGTPGLGFALRSRVSRGWVDQSDYTTWADSYGHSYQHPSMVPEPALVSLLSLGALGMLPRKRVRRQRGVSLGLPKLPN